MSTATRPSIVSLLNKQSSHSLLGVLTGNSEFSQTKAAAPNPALAETIESRLAELQAMPMEEQQSLVGDTVRNLLARNAATGSKLIPEQMSSALQGVGAAGGVDFTPNFLERIANSNAVRNPWVMGGLAASVPALAYGAYRFGKSRNKPTPEELAAQEAQPKMASAHFSYTPPVTAAQAFVTCRKISKQASWSDALGQVGQFLGDHPVAAGALGGAAIGGLTGIGSGNMLRNATIGAGIGGIGGLGYSGYRNYQNNSRMEAAQHEQERSSAEQHLIAGEAREAAAAQVKADQIRAWELQQAVGNRSVSPVEEYLSGISNAQREAARNQAHTLSGRQGEAMQPEGWASSVVSDAIPQWAVDSGDAIVGAPAAIRRQVVRPFNAVAESGLMAPIRALGAMSTQRRANQQGLNALLRPQ